MGSQAAEALGASWTVGACSEAAGAVAAESWKPFLVCTLTAVSGNLAAEAPVVVGVLEAA